MNDLRQLIKIEFEKWSSKSYDELLKVVTMSNEHNYEHNIQTSYVNVVVTLLEHKPTYLHPMIEIQAWPIVEKKSLLQKIVGDDIENFHYDWIVYKDGRIDV